MTRTLILMLAALAFAGCGGAKPAADTAADHMAKAGEHAEEAAEHKEEAANAGSPEEAAGHMEEADAETNEAKEHADEAAGTAKDEMIVTGDAATCTAMTDDEYMVMITPIPQKPAVGKNTWDILIHAPGMVPPAEGAVEIEAELVNTSTGKNVEGLILTSGKPGEGVLAFSIDTPGEYEAEIHVDRGSAGDSHTKFQFTVS